MKIEDLSTWQAFASVATAGSFTGAARQLKVPPPQISKRIAKLETQLGARLFHRTTRSVQLTDEARALLPKIQTILEDLHEAESLFDRQDHISGTIKLTSVPFIAHQLLLPIMADFRRLHPDIDFEIDLSETMRPLIEYGFDLAVRIESPKDSSMVYRKLIPNELVFCAAPHYLKRHGKPLDSPDDLAAHELLYLSIHQRCEIDAGRWRLEQFKAARKIVCEDGAFLTAMALQGMGILVRSIWDVQEHFKQGDWSPF